MEKVSKTTTIINAFKGSIPMGEPWYEERMSKCNGCKYNSKNKEVSSLKDFAKEILHVGKPFCTLCGCFTHLKASMKEEYCALKDKGETPLWNALAVKTIDSSDWDVYNNTPEKCTIGISPEKDAYQLDFGTVKKTSDISCSLVFEGKNLEMIQVTKTCGCTSLDFKNLGNGMYQVSASLDPNALNGVFRKNIYISYLKHGQTLQTIVRLTGTML